MKIKIAAIGSNLIIANEICTVIRNIVGNAYALQPLIAKTVTSSDKFDLYVCAVTQGEVMAAIIPDDKLVVLDLRPSASFFIDISHIPAPADIYIFNSNLRYALLLKEMCEKLHIRNLNFIPLAYEDMELEAVRTCLKKAKYIVGVADLVGQNALLSTVYKSYLSDDVTIIGRTRVATIDTACLFLNKLQIILNLKMGQKIAALAEKLQTAASPHKTLRIKAVLDMIIRKQAKGSAMIKQNLLKSFASQIDNQIFISADNFPTNGIAMEDSIISTLNTLDHLNLALNTQK